MDKLRRRRIRRGVLATAVGLGVGFSWVAASAVIWARSSAVVLTTTAAA